jgi:iron complex outermembrane recepter protein
MKKLILLSLIVLSSQMLFAQFFKGNLKDEKGNAIVGASIVEVKVENNATTSDANGNFSIIAFKQGSSMKISCLGFESTIISFNQAQTSIILTRAARALNTTQIIGSRNTQRSLVTSLAPVEIINIKEVTTKFGQVDINQILQYVALSFNSNRQSGSDGADHVDPATFRGLGPDQTLVLINGKRQHQSSLVNIFGTRGRGNNGTDLNVIPAAAIDRIEILHDGAAAQYGSDAIAGVVNIVLKTKVNTVEVTGGTGIAQSNYRNDGKQFDGANYNFGVNYGIAIKENGYVNFTLDRNYHDFTNRADSTLGENYRSKFGDGQIGNLSFFANAKMPINENIYAYSFLGITSRNGNSYSWTRYPGTPANNDTLYPDGFNPIISSKIFDHSLCLGVKSEIGKNWLMDISNTNGANSFNYTINNSLNSSMGAVSPTNGIYAGGFGLSQNTANIDFNKNFASWANGTSVSFGGEIRNEGYNIKAGDEVSYKRYDTVGLRGVQGFPGFTPGNAIKASRMSEALYADIESELTKSWTMAGALRFENYSDFGTTLNYKLSTRYKINDWLAARATISTGFRAPSLPQINFSQTLNNYLLDGSIIEQELVKNGTSISYQMGIPNLRQEKSQNYGAGFTVKLNNKFTVTIDAYQIKIRDRIVLTGLLGTGIDSDIDTILNNLNVDKAQLFANAISTTTRGLDIVGLYTTYFKKDRLNVTLQLIQILN